MLVYMVSRLTTLCIGQPINGLILGRGQFSFSLQSLVAFNFLSRVGPLKIFTFYITISIGTAIVLALFIQPFLGDTVS